MTFNKPILRLRHRDIYTLVDFNQDGYLQCQSFMFLYIKCAKPSLILCVSDDFDRRRLIRIKEQFVIWDGVLKVNIEKVVCKKPLARNIAKHNTYTTQIWPPNDHRYLVRAKSEQVKIPSFERIKYDSGEEKLLNYLTICESD